MESSLSRCLTTVRAKVTGAIAILVGLLGLFGISSRSTSQSFALVPL